MTNKRPVVHRRSERPLPVFRIGIIVVALVAIIATGYGIAGMFGSTTTNHRPSSKTDLTYTTDANQDGASALIEVALDEANDVATAGDTTEWRTAYNRFVGQSSTASWSTAFVVYCGDLCGFVESTLIPKTASASEFLQYYENDSGKGAVHAIEDVYTPQAGDIVVLDETNQGRLGIVEGVDAANSTFQTVEGDADGGIAEKQYSTTAPAIFITPSYPSVSPAPLDSGEAVVIPTGLGSVDTFEGWSLITDPTSTDYQLRAAAGERYDHEGYGIIDGCYVVAVRPIYGSVGDYVTFTFEDGSTIDCIIGDVKGEDGIGVNEWGFLGGDNILEFVVNTSGWYDGHANPGTEGNHPEWGQPIASCLNTGNYWGM